MSDKENNFNFLRFVFASLVIVSHVPELMDGNRNNELLTLIFSTLSFGELAVDSFFIISGFLIVKSWIGNPNYLGFLTNRIFRIVPGFVVASLICALLLGSVYGEVNYIQKFNVIAYVRSLVMLRPPEIPLVFIGSNHPVVNGSMWTIAYEFKCYLLVLLIGSVGVSRYKIAWASICLASLLVFFLNKLNIINVDPYYQYFRFLVPFTVGGCFYLYGEGIVKMKISIPISILGFIFLMYSNAFAEVGVSIFWGCIILSFALYGQGFGFFNRFPDISYGIYLYAWPLNKIMMWYYPDVGVAQGVIFVFLASILAGLMSWYAVESQALKIKKRFLTATPQKGLS